MSELKIEGETNNISESQLEFIKNVIEREGFKDSKVTIEAVGGPADNYGANVKRIVIEGENGNLTMIAKIAPTIVPIRMVMGVEFMFNNEALLYTEVLPKMLELQKKAEIPEEDQLKFPKCYGVNEAPNEVILLEDLKASGFTMLDRFKSLSDEHMTSVLKNLAIYHSLSYVLRTKEPETYDYYKDKLQDLLGAMTQAGPELLGFFYQIEAVALQVLDDSEQKNVVKNKVGEVIEKVGKMTKFEHGSRFAVIQHGDCWTNNIMYKFEGEEVKQSMLIDYQQSKNFSPVYDLLYLIFNCTDHETRVRNYYDWIDYYHDELDNSLSNYGLKANYVYPRDQLDADLKRYGKIGLGCAILMTGTLTISPAEAGKLKEVLDTGNLEGMVGEVGNFNAETLVLFKKRIIDLVESFKLFGLL
ncbi:hypothetical protein PYW07_006579 [Mythimna separata]|uniref:CHK kinase-like domain-containing protein n=1 Tax=Mythimna separata TaxID=271217 RepID=A0AAD8DWW4_MYTSE|nr:hypothetical protein PYW07_006579 [Mythimna separata]